MFISSYLISELKITPLWNLEYFPMPTPFGHEPIKLNSVASSLKSSGFGNYVIGKDY